MSWRESIRAAPWWVWLIIAFVLIAVIGSLGEEGDQDETGDAPTPAKQEASAPAPEPPADLSAEDLVDSGLVDSERFCRAYAQALSAGLGEDFAFGNFLRGYQKVGDQPGAPPAREVFDELVDSC